MIKVEFSGWADAHSHLLDPRVGDLGAVLRQGETLGLGFYLQGGIDPGDWQRQVAGHQRDQRIGLCFGLHPYFVAANSEQDCDKALDQLARMAPQALALGEMGLDFREVYRGSRELQTDCFRAQLELANFAGKPVVLHLVWAHQESLAVLDLEPPVRGGIVHAFSGSEGEAKAFLDRGLKISVGGALCREKNQSLAKAVELIPLSELLLESDSPDQAPPGFAREQNRPWSILGVAERVGQIKNVSKESVLDICSDNLRKLLAIEFSHTEGSYAD